MGQLHPTVTFHTRTRFIARAMNETTSLIAGRECGECFACCTIPGIDSDGLRKPAGVKCGHCAGQGCSIYASRPQACREFYCEWRYQTLLSDDWRPDRSGVMITSRFLQSDGAEPASAVVMIVFGDHAVIFDDGFAVFVATCIDRGLEAILTVPSGPGKLAREARLRPFAGRAVVAGDLGGVKSGIAAAYDAILAMPIK